MLKLSSGPKDTHSPISNSYMYFNIVPPTLYTEDSKVFKLLQSNISQFKNNL